MDHLLSHEFGVELGTAAATFLRTHGNPLNV